MQCAWESLISVLPSWMRSQVDKLGREELQELRFRLQAPPVLITRRGPVYLDRIVREEDISFCINAASRYSPWSAETMASGYLTAPGGHRIGLCGDAVIKAGEMTGIRNIHMACIRVARDFPGLSNAVPTSGSILIIGPPGSGKTTFLRDLIRRYSCSQKGSIAVADERQELFPFVAGECFFDAGKHTDIMSGCPKYICIPTLLRTMGPATIAVDEITASQDCDALIEARWCGVDVLATAHAANLQDLRTRKIYQPLLHDGLFDAIIVINRDKSWHLEGVNK